jgi:hypothetical protein
MKFLKSLPANRKAYNGFEWPAEVGVIVEAPDWTPAAMCGGGLHGLIDGRGNVGLLRLDKDAIWYAFESVDAEGNVSDDDAVAIDCDKGKCRRAIIRAVGTREQATSWLVAAGCTGVHFGTATAGNYGTATAGNEGTATAGDEGTATAGNRGTATAGNGGILIIHWWNGDRSNPSVAKVGNDGIMPNVAYRLDGDGKFIKAII